MDKTSTLAALVSAAEVRMRAELAEARVTLEHRGSKGDLAEEAFRSFLRKYVARRHAIGHGEVVDSSGSRSTQTDVVIANEDHPFTFTEDQPGLFFAEGVSAAGEVKAVLTTQHLKSTIENSRRWKTLRSSPGEGTMVHSNTEDLARFYESPPYFLFAFESQLSLEAVLKTLIESGSYSATPSVRQLDAVFMLDTGTLIDVGSGAGSFQIRDPDGTPGSGWRTGSSGAVLFDALRWLTIAMPRLVRFEPVLARYLFPNARTGA